MPNYWNHTIERVFGRRKRPFWFYAAYEYNQNGCTVHDTRERALEAGAGD